MSYDAWGARRASEHQGADPSSFDLPVGHREFTGHESIPGLALVNMNGRVYDPMLGRFLSPDPSVQFQGNLQSYNRYSYVLNNPLGYTDPTGYSAIGDYLSRWDPRNVDNWGRIFETASTIAVCVGTDGMGCMVWGMELAAYHGLVAIAEGQAVGSVLMSTAINLTVSRATGGIGGDDPVAGLVRGAASSMVSTALNNALSNRPLGENVLTNLADYAWQAGITMSLKAIATPTQASSESAKQAKAAGDAAKLSYRAGLMQRLWMGTFDLVCDFCREAPPPPLDIVDAFLHYVARSGRTWKAPFSQLNAEVGPSYFREFRDLIEFAEPGQNYHIATTASYSVPGADYALFGVVGLRLEGELAVGSSGWWSFEGRMSALNDIYDFNPSTHRGLMGELLTMYGAYVGGKDYEIQFVGSRTVSAQGNLP